MFRVHGKRVRVPQKIFELRFIRLRIHVCRCRRIWLLCFRKFGGVMGSGLVCSACGFVCLGQDTGSRAKGAGFRSGTRFREVETASDFRLDFKMLLVMIILCITMPESSY